ncbi:AbrB/MazE/SpoVT family DNA-binding domain-containing protein (plasmid) [Priestia megaterium]|uniref:AbrB/MazE/SpoVT family DNA-binding domain-containing protein n=1 Tax=Priestia megaterium TaxID=1404 RepID=UPI002452C17C|nr:AbrB/MazE/SpoVT family DNA-binding domain-containing protein [Priestia megaterium]MDH3144355.1 AbrB/MazE/SpoVT family DNA-binding domain-containing protein [Priestia megaterium]
MKTPGSMQKLDELGRAVNPMELPKVLSIKEKGSIEVFYDRSHIILPKYKAHNECRLTGEVTLQDGEYEKQEKSS